MKIIILKSLVILLLTGSVTSYWSDWSLWSACSRTCENGLQYRTRRCLEGNCSSSDTAQEFRVCNEHKPCEEGKSFREIQCENFSGKRHYGKRRTWKPYFDSGSLCALTCKSPDNFVAVLKEKVEDGTPCSDGSTDVCINGICKAVGCDNIIGSNTVADECGVCGGNGGLCKGSRPYQWTPVLGGLCSATCGKGFVNMKFICEDTKKRTEVDEFYCSSEVRPEETKFTCNQKPCPHESRWITEQWGNCSSPCKHGVRYRNVFCTVEGNSVPDENCSGPKPRSNELCHLTKCDAEYVVGDWLHCSATCGEGIRSREVVCLDSNAAPSRFCDPDSAPSSIEVCNSEIPCQIKPALAAEFLRLHDGERGTDSKARSVRERHGKGPISQDARFTSGEWSPCSVTCGEGVRARIVTCQLYLSASKKFAEVPESECRDEKPTALETCFSPPCSMSMIIDHLPVKRPGTNEISAIENDWAEYDYDSGEVEPPIPLESLLMLEPNEITVFEWKPTGYSDCSASCLGGVQKITYDCFRTPENISVDDSLCIEKRPLDVYHVCNEGPCPPRWNVEEFSRCSRTCGGGIQTRQTSCLQDISDGVEIEVPQDKCLSKAPSVRQVCNIMDCPAEWRAGDWTKCSRYNGKCMHKREVMCAVAELADTTGANSTEWKKVARSSCIGHAPKNVEVCQMSECNHGKKKVSIEGNPPGFAFYQKPNKKMVLLTIGGYAEVIKGTWLTIKCPAKGFERSKIKWFKEDKKIRDLDRIEVTHSGNLLVYDVMIKDSGVYKCKAGKASETITLAVKSKSSFTKPVPRKPQFYNEVPLLPLVLESRSQTIDLSLEEQIKMIGNNGSSKDELEKALVKSLAKRELVPNVSFSWLETPWSKCSQLCGTQAFQVRAVDCILRWKNATVETTTDVKPNLCELAGLPPMSATRQQCGMKTCPKWEVGFWSKCEESRCISHYTAVQVREVNCVTDDGQIIDESLCKPEDKPLEKQKCRSRMCEGVWRFEEWSECQSRCGESGMRTRLVLCVWKVDRTSIAGDQCTMESKPPDREGCFGEECGEEGECSDNSVFCKLVPIIKMCNSEQYKDNCCLSCLSGGEISVEYQ